MDLWEELLDNYSKQDLPIDLRGLIRILDRANGILKEDLAPFELEWVLKSLFYKPINLLSIIEENRMDETWSKPIGDIFKLLSSVITKHGDVIGIYFKPIVGICNKGYYPITKKQAIDCLASVSIWSSAVSDSIEEYILALQDGGYCKTPLALYIGSVCEYQPAIIESEKTRVWRIYLNLLESNKKTDTVVTGILQGLLSFFKNFGQDLPIIELNDFHKKISAMYIQGSAEKISNAILSIWAKHAGLFKEIIAEDEPLRRSLWDRLSDSPVKTAAALLGVYDAVFDARAEEDLIKEILTREIVPRFGTTSLLTYTALRVRARAQKAHYIKFTIDKEPVVEHLEFEIRCGKVNDEMADAISWSIECELANSDKLLQTCMMFYENLPYSKVKEVVVYGILRVTADVRKESIIFLITESCQDENSLDNYLLLWSIFLDSANGSDGNILEVSILVFQDIMEYTVFQLKTLLDQELESIPEKTANLLKLVAHVSTLLTPDHSTQEQSASTLRMLVQCMQAWGLCSATVSCGRALLNHNDGLEDPGEFYKMLSIDGCKDEALLCECCLVLIRAEEDVLYQDRIKAFQIIFSRNDVQPKILSDVLSYLNKIASSYSSMNRKEFSNVLEPIKKIRSRKDMVGKDARILQKDILLFLGKHGDKYEPRKEMGEDMLIVKLKDSLKLNVFNRHEDVNYEINLGRILQMATQQENPKVLHVLLTVISASLDVDRRSQSLQRAVSLTCRSLCRAHAHSQTVDTSALTESVLLCDDLQVFFDIITFIEEEKSTGARRMLSDVLETVMHPRTSADVSALAERALLMLDSTNSSTRKAGLYLTESLSTVIKTHTVVITGLVPEFLIKITKTYDEDSKVPFKSLSEGFLHQIALYTDEKVEELTQNLLEVIANKPRSKSWNSGTVYKRTVEMCLDFLKNVIEAKKWGVERLFKDKSRKYGVSWLYVMARLKRAFGCELEIYLLRDVKEELEGIVLSEEVFVWETVFTVLEEFATGLIRDSFEETLQYLSNITTKLTPRIIIKTSRPLIKCYSTFKEMCNGFPQVKINFKSWWKSLDLDAINNALREIEGNNLKEVGIILASMKVMLSCFSTESLDGDRVRSWADLVLKTQGTVPENILEDALTVSLKFLTVEDVNQLLDKNMSYQHRLVFFERFHEESLVEKIDCWCVLNDLVKWCLMKLSVETCDAVLRIVDKLWPTYETEATFEQKVSLLVDLRRLPKTLEPTSKPMSWAVAKFKECGVSEKIRLIIALPPGEAYSSAYIAYAALMPTRLHEMSGEFGAMLRALLDAAVNGDLTLFNIIATLSADEDSVGWWNEAIESFVATIALKADKRIYEEAFKRTWEGLSLSTGVCERLLVPLLRYSTATFCEDFLSSVLKELLNKLSVVSKPSLHYEYRKRVADYTCAFMILQVAFEKVPDSLESPNSGLYRFLDIDKTWYLVIRTCKLSDQLQKDVICPPNADEQFKNIYRKFRCAAYTSMCSAVCRRRPSAKVYKHLLDTNLLAPLVDEEHVYQLPLRSRMHTKKIRKAVGVDVTEKDSMARTIGGSTVRTKIFLRTLTENPLHFDLLPSESQMVTTQEVELVDSELNGHPCAATLTALLSHVSSSKDQNCQESCLEAIIEILTKETHQNLKWLIAQAICNNRQELSQHASVLRGPMIQFVAETAKKIVGGDREEYELNGLHIDVLDTLSWWRDKVTLEEVKYLNITIDYLITTIVKNRSQNIHECLIQSLNNFMSVHGKNVTVQWSTFKPYFERPTIETKSCIRVLSILAKDNIKMQELLPTLLDRLKSKTWCQELKTWSSLGKVATLFGLTCEGRYLNEYRTILDQTRRPNVAEYIKMLYYAQTEFNRCCDRVNFKRMCNLVWQVGRPERSKCLYVMGSYLEWQSSKDSDLEQILNSLDHQGLIDSHPVEAIELVKNSLHMMDDELKKRLVKQISGYCNNSHKKIRTAALGAMLQAFKELFPPTSASDKKRIRHNTSSIIASAVDKNVDEYIDIVLTSLGIGITRTLDDGEGPVAKEVAGLIDDKDMAIRFVECFILAVYLPGVRGSSLIEPDLCVCLSALTGLLLSKLRAHDTFKNSKLRDKPLDVRNSNAEPSKLLTRSKTYQPSVLSFYQNQKSERISTTSKITSGIDVQMSIDSILETLLQFAKVNVEAGISLCVELVKDIRSKSSLGFDFGSSMSVLLAELMMKVNALTPLVVEVCRLFIDDVSKIDGFQKSLESLITTTRGSEAEDMIKLLLEEVRLRTSGNEIFVLGVLENDVDVEMYASNPFSLKDLISTFGKLSNWDDLRLQDKRRLEATLPSLWTSIETFINHLEMYESGNSSLLDKLLSCSRDDSLESFRLVKDLGKWPSNQFVLSAVTELIQLYSSEIDDFHLAPFDLRKSDCLAEWVARFMIRKTTISRINSNERIKVLNEENKTQEFLWCSVANDWGIPRLVIECVENNIKDLPSADRIPWFLQEVKARRTLAIRQNDEETLRGMLEEVSDSYRISKDSVQPEVLLQMMSLLLRLTEDLQDFSKINLDDILSDAKRFWLEIRNFSSKAEVEAMFAINDIARSRYMVLWENCDVNEKNSILLTLFELLAGGMEICPSKTQGKIYAVLNCLENWTGLSQDVAKTVLEKLGALPPTLLEEVRSHLLKNWQSLVQDGLWVTPVGDSLEIYKKCLQLVADANHLLRSYCEDLAVALNNQDKDGWKRIFDFMKERIFENVFAGDDYRVLYIHKEELYSIYDYDQSDDTKKFSTLKDIVSKLDKQQRPVLALSQLCPTLCGDLSCKTSLSTLLGLTNGVTVVKFNDQVRVVLGSKRRPCVLEARLSNGRVLSLLQKSGDHMRVDASAQKTGRLLAGFCPAGTNFRHYEVTVLGEDCGLIEYLEDHETIGNVIASSCNLNQTVSVLKDEEKILSATKSRLQQYRMLCDQLPANTLRTEIEKRSSCLEDFIEKKRHFLDSLAFMTVLVWLLGLGDRHVNNIMYDVNTGTLCCIDWGAIIQFGSPGELPPARLTRNMLAVCDAAVLESRIQTILSSLRESRNFIIPALKSIFKWMGDKFNEKLPYIEGILDGRILSHEITKDVIMKSNEKYKEKYLGLFKEIFGNYEKKSVYTVEEQVSNLLKHCTDERILSVTRTDWEPWV